MSSEWVPWECHTQRYTQRYTQEKGHLLPFCCQLLPDVLHTINIMFFDVRKIFRPLQFLSWAWNERNGLFGIRKLGKPVSMFLWGVILSHSIFTSWSIMCTLQHTLSALLLCRMIWCFLVYHNMQRFESHLFAILKDGYELCCLFVALQHWFMFLVCILHVEMILFCSMPKACMTPANHLPVSFVLKQKTANPWNFRQTFDEHLRPKVGSQRPPHMLITDNPHQERMEGWRGPKRALPPEVQPLNPQQLQRTWG